jgi:zinc protease
MAGDISAQRAAQLADKYFGKWSGNGDFKSSANAGVGSGSGVVAKDVVNRILIVDLPNSGQAAVTYAKPVKGVGRGADAYYTASVLNSLLGGGYSSRLNQEIRIKRGLSYGAGSNFGWRMSNASFGARAQTKNESAAIVAELLVGELRRLTSEAIPAAELDPRKAVLTGGFGRNVETTGGLVNALADLYTFGVPTSALNSYIPTVTGVAGNQVTAFASATLLGGDLVIVGDYSVFKDDLAKRFPNKTVTVVKADTLDLSKL